MNTIKIKSKKAISPLIATVLLIAFAVALGAVVMNWGGSQLRDQEICSKIDISLEKINNLPHLCFSEGQQNQISFLLVNQGTTILNKMRVTLISSDPIDPYNNVIIDKVHPGETKRIQMNYPSNFGKIQQVRITPLYVDDVNNPMLEHPCLDKRIEVLKPIPC